ncbi:uridylate kinase [Bradyrhizobium guangxiense]|uniref:amino acid kinase family protein n=1 Tax=Bradyrhizobium guangxiense TaxID=1325115 RepID=UPI0010087B9C|nr:uridylate kinase [Bradyrhizobium guangxiense]
MSIKVMKFGGSSFRDAEAYRAVSRHIVDRLANDARQVVVVVSAMHGQTDVLKSLALSVNEICSTVALDTVLTAGEMISAGLLEAALQRHSVPTSSLFGYSIGIKTSLVLGRTVIEEVDNKPLLKALDYGRVVILAGAQGLDEGGRVSMLGRNSSDLTAVIAADMVGSGVCEVYSDVCGIYSADPRIVRQARLLPTVSYANASRIARCGAKVLHHGAIDYAAGRRIAISCKSLLPNEMAGTLVTDAGGGVCVVINPSATRGAFQSVFEKRNAEDVLRRLGIMWIDLEQDESPEGYLTHDAEAALTALHREGIHPVRSAQKIVVLALTGSKPKTYELRDLEAASYCAQRVHAELRTSGVEAPH